MVKVDKVSKSFGTQKTLNCASFWLKNNSIIGLCGRNGVGKTTLIKLLLDIYIPDNGTIVRENKYTKVIFDTLPQMDTFKVKDFLDLFSLVYRGKKLKREELSSILERVNMRVSKDKKVGELSFGMKKMLYVSTLLLGETDFAIIDEPFNGLDSVSISIVKEIVTEIKEKYNATIIISSHLLNELAEMCEHFILLKDGEAKYVENINAVSNMLKITYEDDGNIMTCLAEFGVITKQGANYCELCLNSGVRSSDVIKGLNRRDIVFDEIYYQNVFDI